MSVQPIVDTLEKITKLHDNLLTVSKKKTEALTKGDTDLLQELLLNERKYVQAINQLETKRMEQMSVWAKTKGIEPTNLTVSVMVENYVTGPDQESLELITVKLAELLVDLKQQEQLNQQLTKQSMQFIQMTMNMISPTITSMNYGNQTTKSNDQQSNRSLFDSKA